MNLIDLRRRYPRLLLFGGVDVSELLPFGTPEQIENVRVFYDAIRKYGKYPLN